MNHTRTTYRVAMEYADGFTLTSTHDTMDDAVATIDRLRETAMAHASITTITETTIDMIHDIALGRSIDEWKTEPCADCAEPVRWDNDRNDWFHVDPDLTCGLHPRNMGVTS